MLLWTIQHRAAYENMLATGTLRADEMHLFCENDLRFAYDWMAEQMRMRIGEPPQNVRYPVWAWYQFVGMRKRPDMRTHRHWGAKGIPIVLLTVDVPDEAALLSDYSTWHVVLANCHLSRADDDDPEEYTEAEKKASWENVFPGEDGTVFGEEAHSIQATLWEIRLEWVKKAEHFITA